MVLNSWQVYYHFPSKSVWDSLSFQNQPQKCVSQYKYDGFAPDVKLLSILELQIS